MPAKADGKKAAAKKAVALVLAAMIAGFVTGCSALRQEEGMLREAVEERRTAQARLASAITVYCSVRNDSLEARTRCVAEKQLELHRIVYEASLHADNGPPHENSGAGGLSIGDARGLGSVPVITCEQTRFRTTCQKRNLLVSGPSGG